MSSRLRCTVSEGRARLGVASGKLLGFFSELNAAPERVFRRIAKIEERRLCKWERTFGLARSLVIGGARRLPGAVKGARFLRAAERTLDGEDSRRRMEHERTRDWEEKDLLPYCPFRISKRMVKRSRAERIGRAVAHLSLSSSRASSRMPRARRMIALIVVLSDSTTPKRTG